MCLLLVGDNNRKQKQDTFNLGILIATNKEDFDRGEKWEWEMGGRA